MKREEISAAASYPKLLVVDDDAPLMKALCQTLETEGYAVKGFTSANQALARLREEEFDLLLSDLMMPEMDGITVVRSALAIDPNLVAVVMTGHGTVDTAVQAMKEGALDYILKPFKLSVVLPALTRAVSVRRLRLENIQLNQAAAINELSVAIAFTHDYETILHKLEDAALLMGASNAHVLLVSDDGQHLRMAATRGENRDGGANTQVAFGAELQSWLRISRELISHPESAASNPLALSAPLPGIPKGISAPMLAGGDLVGILNLGFPRLRPQVTPGQIKALSTLASTAASAIEAALLLAQVKAAEERYRRLAENAPDIVFRYELYPRRGFVYVSPVVTSICGYSPEEHYADANFSAKLAHPDDLALVESVLRGEKESGTTITVRWRHKNGGSLWIEQKNVHLRDAEGRLVAIEGIARDISERRRLEEQFQQAQKLESVGRLAAGVAHDFNNLLTVINGYTELSVEDLPEDSPIHHNLAEVLAAGDQAAALTRQLLAFSRKELASPSVVDVNGMITSLKNMLRRLIGEDIDLRTNLAPDLGNVLMDSGHFQQVIMNLAVNSRDAMPDGGALRIETLIVAVGEALAAGHPGARPGDHVVVSVSDTGMGMTPEVLHRVFEPFFTTKPQGVGTGLGLATVHSIVKQAGGWIRVDSELGGGTRFQIFLPRIEEAAENVPERFSQLPGGDETILVVEDEADVLKLTVAELKKLGYKVYGFQIPADALALIRSLREPLHLVLTDVVMPDMNGTLLSERLRASYPTLPVLFMSGYTDEIVGKYGIPQLGNSFLKKPFSADTLAKKVREALGRRSVPNAAVLVVDEDAAVRKVLRQSLEGAGYSVFEARRDSQGIEIAASSAVELVILDVVPGRDSLKILETMRGTLPNLKAILMSGAFGTDAAGLASEASGIVILEKPIDQNDLLEAVNRALTF